MEAKQAPERLPRAFEQMVHANRPDGRTVIGATAVGVQSLRHRFHCSIVSPSGMLAPAVIGGVAGDAPHI